MVVLKNTKEYNGGKTRDLNDIKVLQMIGRAGRPQFDTSAVSLIITTNSKIAKYSNLMAGMEEIESR